MNNYLHEELYSKLVKDKKTFDFLQKTSLDGLWYWDLENPENEWMSNKFWTELGYEPNEMPHSPSSWHKIIFKDDLKKAKRAKEEHIKNPKTPFDIILRFIHKNGSIIFVRCRGKAIMNSENKPIRMLGAHNNITRAVRAVKRQKLLEIQKKSFDEYVYITSHDLQEPLDTIISFNSLLKENTKTDNEQREYLNIIESSAFRMKKLLKSLQDFTRVDEAVDKEFLNLRDIIENVEFNLHSLIEENKAQLIYPQEELLLNVYQESFTKLIQNILSNAIKFSKENVKTIISIQYKENPNYIELSITDNGIGIDKRHFSKIFEVFRTLKPNKNQESTGIGLAYCKRVAELHNGILSVKSTLGIGSTFTLKIPKNL